MAEKLINLVRQHECLYNNRLGHYKYGKWRKDAWTKISMQMNLPVAECRRKWNLLRNAFAHALSRRNRPPHQMGIRILNKWTYEDEMAFLTPFVVRKKSSAFQIDQANQDGDEENSMTINDNDCIDESNNDNDCVDESNNDNYCIDESNNENDCVDESINDVEFFVKNAKVKLESDIVECENYDEVENVSATEVHCDTDIKIESLLEDHFEDVKIEQPEDVTDNVEEEVEIVEQSDVATQIAPIEDIIDNINQTLPSTNLHSAVKNNHVQDYCIIPPKGKLITKPKIKIPQHMERIHIQAKPETIQNMQRIHFKAKPETMLMELQKEKREMQPKDEIDLLFQSMAMAVKRMPVAEQIRVKLDITRVICDAQLRCEKR